MQTIKLVILDVDGVLTDGRIGYDSKLDDIKFFNAKDGFFIKHICNKLGIEFAIISGGISKIVKHRAELLGINYVYTGFVEKEEAYLKLKKDLDHQNEEIAYMGDDWFDWPAMKHAGLKAAPADAATEIIEKADFVSTKEGGRGAVREFLEFILKRDSKYEQALKLYF